MTAPTEPLWLQPEQPGNIVRQRRDGHWDVADAEYLNGLEAALKGERQTALDLADWADDLAQWTEDLPAEVSEGLRRHLQRAREIVRARVLRAPAKVIQL